MHINDAVFLEDLCPKFRFRQWRKSIHKFTGKSCIYCGKPSESIDHVIPRSQGGLSKTENCVPACLSCNGDKSDENALYWYCLLYTSPSPRDSDSSRMPSSA